MAGSRGDVQPYVALGVGLLRAGHRVKVVTTRDHDALVRAHGLELASVPVDVQAAQLTAEVGLEAARGADVIVTGFGGAFIAEGIAARLGVPLVQAYNVPLTPTAAFPGALHLAAQAARCNELAIRHVDRPGGPCHEQRS